MPPKKKPECDCCKKKRENARKSKTKANEAKANHFAKQYKASQEKLYKGT